MRMEYGRCPQPREKGGVRNTGDCIHVHVRYLLRVERAEFGGEYGEKQSLWSKYMYIYIHVHVCTVASCNGSITYGFYIHPLGGQAAFARGILHVFMTH